MTLPARKLTTAERRLTVIIGIVPVLTWTLISTLAHQTRSAWWFAWQEVRIECAEMRRAWTDKNWRPK